MTTPDQIVPAPERVGQGTAVEQTRAAAEVAAAVRVARDCPRSLQSAVRAMTESCKMKVFAERAFFAYPKGGKTISGPSVYLARELARCFGNFDFGIVELRRDDEYRQSEMRAYAWDIEMNTRSSLTFINPHGRDTKKGVEDLTDLRDIYENNTNMGARRLRTVILGLLPPWFVDQAVDLCRRTLADGGGVPLPRRIATAVEMYASNGVSADQLAQRFGRHPDKWNDHDLAQASIVWRSIGRGELRLEDEFPPERVTAAEVAASAPAGPVEPTGDAEEAEPVTDWETAVPGKAGA